MENTQSLVSALASASLNALSSPRLVDSDTASVEADGRQIVREVDCAEIADSVIRAKEDEDDLAY